MINPHSLLAQLPALRKGLGKAHITVTTGNRKLKTGFETGIIQFVAGLGDFLTSIILLAYQLALTVRETMSYIYTEL